jgi:DnaJ-class molecular chaperone
VTAIATVTCPTCHGSGTILVKATPNGQGEGDNVVEVEQTCPTCSGEGRVEVPDEDDGGNGRRGRRG